VTVVIQRIGTAEGYSSTRERDLVLTVGGSAVEHIGDSVWLDPKLMIVGEPYPFRFLGYPLIAVKRPDGAIDFFSLPDES